MEEFNAARERFVIPGQHVVVDECMSSWTGCEATFNAYGMPHKTKIARKPEGVGAELKALACGSTGILLKLEIMEGKDANRQKLYSAEYGEGTAVVLRLSSSLFGSGRIVHADSAFSSVKTLIALEDRGLYFQGMVKTAHKEYPKQFFKRWEDGCEEGGVPARGNWCLLESKTPKDNSMFALAWKDKKVKTIISNVGTTNPGNPCKRKRYMRVEKDGVYETTEYYKEISRPAMIELFFSCFGVIDVHDHYRQGSLAFERDWYTHSWWHRIFATLLGMCIVDAYLAYKFEGEDARDSILDFKGFIGRVAYQLIHNHYLEQAMVLRSCDTSVTNGKV